MNFSSAPAPAVFPDDSRHPRRRFCPHPAALFALAGVVAMSAIPTALLTHAQQSHPAPTAAARTSPQPPIRGALVSAIGAMARSRADADGSSVDRQLSKDAALRRTLAKLRAARSGVAASSVVIGGSVSDIPAVAAAAYQQAAAAANRSTPACDIPWTLIAGIGRVESDHGRNGGSSLRADGEARPAILGPVLDGSDGNAAITDTDHGRYDGNTRWDRAVGPMQFIPSTWATWGRDGNGDATFDPENIFDSALAAADYLCASGGDLNTPDGAERAVLSYNHSPAYVLVVLGYGSSYGGQDLSPVSAELARYLTALATAQPKPSKNPAPKKPVKKPAPRPSASTTASPTARPTPTPTPTPRPTVKPTVKPTPKPTRKPTPTPTPTPTPSPTQAPVPTPTNSVSSTVSTLTTAP